MLKKIFNSFQNLQNGEKLRIKQPEATKHNTPNNTEGTAVMATEWQLLWLASLTLLFGRNWILALAL